MTTVQVLVNNYVKKKGLIAEQGLSLLIKNNQKQIVFDVGQAYALSQNVKKLRIDLKGTDYIILSHGHYDHCGGLEYFPLNNVQKLYLHPDALNRKYRIEGENAPVENGIPWSFNNIPITKEQIVFNRHMLEIDQGIYLSGEIPRVTEFEKESQIFYNEINYNFIIDKMTDEQMLIIEDNDGLVLFLGCSHCGVINGIKYVQELFPKKRIKALIAGMHMENVEPKKLDKIIDSLNEANIETVIPLHCTGMETTCILKSRLNSKVPILYVGDIIEI